MSYHSISQSSSNELHIGSLRCNEAGENVHQRIETSTRHRLFISICSPQARSRCPLMQIIPFVYKLLVQ
ncbi:hypothetical protein MTR_8g065990 [Medicago truncatula]|uniref:Uncharacterized protein n=1 Tax=Medicago truncatula TaxID=3880 RepID=G7LG81_MEDTR|nr:hypothetical protein MTR_8g065990 [Medicago truncatula]